MKKIICLVFMTCFSGAVFAETAKDAFVALQKLETRTEVGINFKDYSAEVGKTKYTVDQFTKNTKFKPMSREETCAMTLNLAMEQYLTALSSWRLGIEARMPPNLSEYWSAASDTLKDAKTRCKIK